MIELYASPVVGEANVESKPVDAGHLGCPNVVSPMLRLLVTCEANLNAERNQQLPQNSLELRHNGDSYHVVGKHSTARITRHRPVPTGRVSPVNGMFHDAHG
jgi:hypothetical protein